MRAEALALPGVHAVWTYRRCRAHPADRFPADRTEGARALSAARAGAATSCAMSASRSRWCSLTIAYHRRGCGRSDRARYRAAAGRSYATDRSGVSTGDHRHRSRDLAKDIWRCRCGVSQRRTRSLRSNLRSAAIPACRWRRAAPSRATTKRATSWKCMAPPRCRTGIATGSRKCSAGNRQACNLRGSCRRRLRHSRRNLSRGRAGLRGGAEIPADR